MVIRSCTPTPSHPYTHQKQKERKKNKNNLRKNLKIKLAEYIKIISFKIFAVNNVDLA